METFKLIYRCNECGHRVPITLKASETPEDLNHVYEKMRRLEQDLLKRVCQSCGKLGLQFEQVADCDD